MTIRHTAAQAASVEAAVAFAERGDSVRIVTATPAGGDRGPVLDLTGGEPNAWRFTDDRGDDITSTAAARRAVLRGLGVLEVQVRTGDRVLARGRVKVRRRVGGTVASALSALGPLVVEATRAEAGEAEPAVPQGMPGARLVDAVAVLRTAAEAARAAVTVWRWTVARWPTDLDGLLAGAAEQTAVTWFGPRRSAFWADPHVVVHDGQEWLFVEDLDRSTGMGRIRATQYLGGELLSREVVLATPHHLSFPQVYRVGGRWLATAETCAEVNPVYTFDQLGDLWRVADDLPCVPPHLADPILIFDRHGTLTEAWGTDARLDPDAVFVRYRWHDGRWRRTDQDTYVDVTRGRSGGTLDLERGLRAVQDCGAAYGIAAEILDPAHMADGSRPILRLTAAAVSGHPRRKGVHTVTWDPSGTAVWIDGWYRRFSLIGAVLRLREQRHAKGCTG